MDVIRSVDKGVKIFLIRDNQDIVHLKLVKREFQNIIHDFLLDHTQNTSDRIGSEGPAMVRTPVCLDVFLSKFSVPKK